jgi:hypothetical protein
LLQEGILHGLAPPKPRRGDFIPLLMMSFGGWHGLEMDFAFEVCRTQAPSESYINIVPLLNYIDNPPKGAALLRLRLELDFVMG